MIQYNNTYAGQYYQLTNGVVYELRADGKFAGTSASMDDYNPVVQVQLTGFTRLGADGNTMAQTTSDSWIRLADGWQNVGYSPLKQYSQADAEYYVDKLIKNNARILENNLVCAMFPGKFTAEQRTELYFLQKRLQERNARLLNDGLCTNLKQAYPPGYSLLENKLNEFMTGWDNGIYGVGLVVSASTIIVSAVVIASLATAAYFAYKALYNESEQDVKYSDELTKILLSKLTSEEYELLKKETQGIVTKSKLRAKLNNTGNILKWGLVLLGGYAAYKVIMDKKGGFV